MREADLTDVLIVQADRLNNSANGNPRFELTFTTRTGLFKGTHRTSPDAACSYEVLNFAGKARTCDVWLTRGGAVEYIKEAEKTDT